MKYRGASIITPNHIEAAIAVGQKITEQVSFAQIGQTLLEKTQCKAVLITLAEKGMLLCDRNGNIVYFPTRVGQVCDTTGAGDTVVATLALGIALGLKLVDCVDIANYAASIVVAKTGTATVTLKELEKLLINVGW